MDKERRLRDNEAFFSLTQVQRINSQFSTLNSQLLETIPVKDSERSDQVPYGDLGGIDKVHTSRVGIVT